jgi:hypothetical protein
MKQYERLSRLRDFKVEKHQIDPRGWDVINLDGRTVGEVRDLIVDTQTMKGVYLEVELDYKQFQLRHDPRVLVPVERAERQGTQKRLLVPTLGDGRVQEMVDERDRAYIEVWDRLWQRQLTVDDLRVALDRARPGEQVRIPILDEEIVVERRPLPRVDPCDEPPIFRDTEAPVMRER